MSAAPQVADAGRAARVLAAAALGVALTGYAVGLSQVGAPTAVALPVATGPAPALEGVAPLWSEHGTRRRGPNAAFATRVPAGAAPARTASAPDDADPAARAASLRRRAERRAYDGAPPVIPHPVDPTSVAACLACHEHGLRLGDLVASPMPHAAYASCTQCHAPAAPSALSAAAGPPLTWNAFEGLPAPDGGERAWTGAPPVIPHATWMRDDCMSCHGPNGAAGLRTTHPWRQSCTQCHAPRTQSP